MYSFAGLNDKISKAKVNKVSFNKIFVALNVYLQNEGTCHLSQEDNMGNHWSLLVINIAETNSYCNDSLSWPVPLT